jgi:hypothetical protein
VIHAYVSKEQFKSRRTASHENIVVAMHQSKGAESPLWGTVLFVRSQVYFKCCLMTVLSIGVPVEREQSQGGEKPYP